MKNYSNINEDNCTHITHYISIELLVLHLGYKNLDIVTYAIDVIGNICSGSASNVDAVINAKGLPLLQQVLITSTNNPKLQGEICWAVSNIAAGPDRHVELLITSGILQDICRLILSSSDLNVSSINRIGNEGSDVDIM